MRFICSAILIVLVFSISFIPQIILDNIPKTEYVRPVSMDYQEKVVAGGYISSSAMREAYINSPLIASELNFEVGDTVQKGDIIAVIDTEQTEAALKNSLTAEQSNTGISPSDISGISSVMAAYGINQEGIADILSKQLPTVTSVSKSKEVIIPSVLTAPMTGTITELSLQEGVLTQTDRPVVAISNTAAYIAKVLIGEDDISCISLGNMAVISGEALGKTTYNGTVSKIYPTANRNGEVATVTVEIAISAPDNTLKDGYSVVAEIFTGSPKQIISIPYEAVGQDTENIEYVYIYSSGRAIRKDISTGTEMTYCTEIDGVTTDSVVLLDPERLEDGSRVIVTGESNVVYD